MVVVVDAVLEDTGVGVDGRVLAAPTEAEVRASAAGVPLGDSDAFLGGGWCGLSADWEVGGGCWGPPVATAVAAWARGLVLDEEGDTAGDLGFFAASALFASSSILLASIFFWRTSQSWKSLRLDEAEGLALVRGLDFLDPEGVGVDVLVLGDDMVKVLMTLIV